MEERERDTSLFFFLFLPFPVILPVSRVAPEAGKPLTFVRARRTFTSEIREGRRRADGTRQGVDFSPFSLLPCFSLFLFFFPFFPALFLRLVTSSEHSARVRGEEVERKDNSLLPFAFFSSPCFFEASTCTILSWRSRIIPREKIEVVVFSSPPPSIPYPFPFGRRMSTGA